MTKEELLHILGDEADEVWRNMNDDNQKESFAKKYVYDHVIRLVERVGIDENVKYHENFEPSELVLVRTLTNEDYDSPRYVWTLANYSHWDEEVGTHILTGAARIDDKNIISYKGNEEKLGRDAGKP